MHPWIHLSVHPSIHPSVCLQTDRTYATISIHLSVQLASYISILHRLLFFCASVCMLTRTQMSRQLILDSALLLVSQSVCLCLCLSVSVCVWSGSVGVCRGLSGSVCLSVCLFVCLSVRPSVYLSVRLPDQWESIHMFCYTHSMSCGACAMVRESALHTTSRGP